MSDCNKIFFLDQQQQRQEHISPSPPPLQHQSPQVPRSIWGNVNDDKVSHQTNEPKVTKIVYNLSQIPI